MDAFIFQQPFLQQLVLVGMIFSTPESDYSLTFLMQLINF